MDFSKYNLENFNHDYCAAGNALRKAAEEAFEAQPVTEGGTDRQRRENRKEFISRQIDTWFCQQPDGCSIFTTHSDTSDEVRDAYYYGTITVYGPSRQPDFEASRAANKQVYKIVPGYINASSWCAGSGTADVFHTTRELKHRLRMMQMALDLLNKRNELCLEWERVESPWELAEECKRRREQEKNQLAQQQEAKAKKAKR